MPLESWFDIELPKIKEKVIAEAKAEAMAEAKAEVSGEAEAKAEQRMADLYSVMERDGRAAEFLAALKDRAIFHQLYQEYHIEDPFGYRQETEL